MKQLPLGITPPFLLVYDASSVPIIQLALSSDTLSQTELNDLATNFIRPALATIPGVQLPNAYGGAARQVQIDLDQNALRAHGLSATDIGSALARQNLITPVGTEKIGSYEYTIDLNDSPKAIEDFDNLPIKVVNGVVVFMRDVAHVHNGSPPQTNVVQSDGRKGVLMSVLKIGSASTLDIIAGVKARLPAIQATLPDGVNLKYVADQSGFVKSSVAAVVREGLIAAALTGFMILVFLGSWRSTFIITVSIPLAVLSSLIVLSALGQTINVMTLGGLALAVGILVDDATVTIENINRHMEEHGEDILTAITHGAQEIMAPATIALFCICIAFVPLLSLGGVAGYLFRPLAMAVVFAMIASYILTYTLVPTMAHFLLRNQHHHSTRSEAGGPPPKGVFARFQHGFEHYFERLRQGYLGLLELALQHRFWFAGGFLCVALASFGLAPFLGQDFFPSIDAGAIRIHMRAPTGTRIEETTRLTDQVEQKIRALLPPDRIASIVDNIGLPNSGINISYGSSGTIGVFDADISVSLKEGETATDVYVKTLREQLPLAFPGTTFSFLPADIVTQILNFGSPAPLDVQIAGANLNASRAFANKLLAKIRSVPGVADPRIQEQFQDPALKVDFNRELAGVVGLTESDAATSIQATLSGSTQTAPTYWLNPTNGVSYPVSVQTPQYGIDTLGELKNLPLTAASFHPIARRSRHLLARAARRDRFTLRYQAGRQHLCDDTGPRSWQRRRRGAENRRRFPRGPAQRLDRHDSRAGPHHDGRLPAVVYRFGDVDRPDLSADRRQFPVLDRSFRDHHGASSGSRRHRLDAVPHLTTLSVPALTGAIMCMGVATANSILVVSFARERLSEGKDALTAALEAGGTRFRPVIMTALAMIIGMAPMAIEPGQNSPLGRAVIGGLLFATFATLVFVPMLFSIAHGRQPRPAEAAEPPSGAPSHA